MRTAFLCSLLICSLPPSSLAEPHRPGADLPAFLGGAGLLPAERHAFFVNADTELSGYPVAIVGWRMGLLGVADMGVEAGGNDVAILGRLHGKIRLFESREHRWFVGARLRVELKRHKQDFGDLFRPIDDFGFTFVPELSLGLRLGASKRQAIHLSVFYYLDVDIRADHGLDHYLMPGLLGYEICLWDGLHLGAEAGIFFEVGRPETAGEPIIKAGLTLGYVF